MDGSSAPLARTFIFGGLIAFFPFWLAGQAATLRWQVHHLVTHFPEVVQPASSQAMPSAAP